MNSRTSHTHTYTHFTYITAPSYNLAQCCEKLSGSPQQWKIAFLESHTHTIIMWPLHVVTPPFSTSRLAPSSSLCLSRCQCCPQHLKPHQYSQRFPLQHLFPSLATTKTLIILLGISDPIHLSPSIPLHFSKDARFACSDYRVYSVFCFHATLDFSLSRSLFFCLAVKEAFREWLTG